MFTGIITELGTVTKTSKKGETLSIEVKVKDSKNLKIGESIAINGACMTITRKSAGKISFDVIEESINRTNLGGLRKGSKVNIELPVKANQRMDGHIVQGHIDNCTKIKSIEKNVFTLQTPKNLKKYIATKGSVAINGVSLTVSKLSNSTFSVSLIPHTLKTTNLSNLKENDEVNLEVDIISRYLEQLTKK